ncbi:MAG: endonuclease [Bacteroidota bacterium]
MRTVFSTFFLFFSLIAYSQPANYYDNATGTGETLKTQLYNIISAGHDPLSYDDLWDAFLTTDDKINGKVWDMYSDVPGGSPPYEFTFVSDQCGNYSAEGDCYNREHSWPSSWFNDASPMYTDLFQLVPTDGYVNNRRGNYIFGEVGSATWTSLNGSKLGNCITTGYSGTVFEPIDEYKGDFARNYFYMVTRYENKVIAWSSNNIVSDILDGTTHPAFETWFLNMLGEWHTADPVSQKETDRNNAAYALQGNRNPFIDHPEYVTAIWNIGASATLAVTPASLSGFSYASGNGPSASQSYTLSGSSLTPATGTITITGTSNFYVSTNNSTFGSTATVNYSSSTLANTLIYVRLKSGLAVGTYNNNLVVNSGGGAAAVNVTCSGTVTVPVLPEPTNYPASFSAHNIHLIWADANGTILPDGYLVRTSPVSFAAISDPVDGTFYPDGPADKNVAYGIQNVWFTNLIAGTTYYFKLFSYTGAGSSRVYKTDGLVPQLIQATTP